MLFSDVHNWAVFISSVVRRRIPFGCARWTWRQASIDAVAADHAAAGRWLVSQTQLRAQPRLLSYAAARRIGPSCATSAHVSAHWRHAWAHFLIVSPSCFPHSAAQALHSSEQILQTRWANPELPVSRATQVLHNSRHSLQSRMHSLIMIGSWSRDSARHWAHHR